jgi:alcohol dehydrogenase
MNSSSWTYYNPVRVVFRPGALNRLADHVDSTRAALVTSPGFRRRGLVAVIEQALGNRLVAVVDDVKPNPDLIDVQAQGELLRPAVPDTLIALGGGSTIDTAKALARLLSQPEGASLAAMFREGAQAVTVAALPVVAIPTTSGTGAEVTPFGTIWDYEQKKKYSVAGEDLYPRLAILDPELTLQLPEEVTVSSGLDTISHALESAWNRNATPVTLGLVTKSLQLSLRALPAIKDNPGDTAARARMMQASMLAGLAISQSRTALAHAISYPLTANFGLPHGLACSFTLPGLLKFNAASDDGRLADLARCLGYASAGELAHALSRLFERLGVGRCVSNYLPDRRSVMALSAQMLAPGRAENNLRAATEEEVRTLVAEALDALQV